MREMKNRDFREIQVSSSILVVIFLAVLALGVFIFLLGVSVGKKQVREAGQSQVAAQTVREKSSDPGSGAPATPEDLAKIPEDESNQTASKAKPATSELKSPPSQQTESKPTTQSGTKPATKSGTGLYYVQVGAFLEKEPALALADNYREQGYAAIVTDPRPNETRPYYRVRLGGFTTRARAQDLLDGLNAAAGRKTDFMVVRN